MLPAAAGEEVRTVVGKGPVYGVNRKYYL